jgi:hypothetical protein
VTRFEHAHSPFTTNHSPLFQILVEKLAIDAHIGHYLKDVILCLGKADLGILA